MSQELAISSPEPNALLLIVENARPLPASLASELLSALSRDYVRQNRGRTLVVSRLDSGSFLIYLNDMAQLAAPFAAAAVEVAKGGKAILDFGKSIRDAIDWKKKSSASDGERDAPSGGPFRSVEIMVKVAAETGSHLRVRQTGSDGSSIDVELSPAEASSIIQRSNQAKQSLTSPAAEKVPDLLISSEQIAGRTATVLADRLQDLALSGSGGSDGAIEAIVEALISAGSIHLVDQIASQLEGQGYSELAAKLRNSGRGGATRQKVTT